MMRRLLFALIPLFAAVIVLARLVGKTQPSTVATIFTNADGSPCERPCLFGIRPGVTTYSEALKFLKIHPLVGGIQGSDGVVMKVGQGALAGKWLRVSMYEDGNGRIVHIALILPQSIPSEAVSIAALAEFVDYLGGPEHYAIVNGGRIYYFETQGIEITSTVDTKLTTTDSPHLAENIFALEVHEVSTNREGYLKWCGFRKPQPAQYTDNCYSQKPQGH
jgi:hypothetical protein